MLNQLKTDRVAQIMLIGVFIAAIFACVGIGIYVYMLSTPTTLYPVIDSSPVAFGLKGQNQHILSFSVATESRILFGAENIGQEPLTVELTDEYHKPIKLIFSEPTKFVATTDEILPAGNYYLHINGDIWTVGVGNN